MATDNVGASSTSQIAATISNYVKDNPGAVEKAESDVASKSAPDMYSDYVKQQTGSDQIGQKQSNIADALKDYTPNASLYGNSNTRDYSLTIESGYTDALKQSTDSIDSNVSAGQKRLSEIQELGEGAYAKLGESVRRDYQEMIDTREAVEANNGNRDGIGHSQYGIAESTADYQRAAIAANIQQLKTDTARQIAELVSRGEYESAKAASDAAKAKLKQMYTDAVKVSDNTYSNYVYEVGLQREDEAIQRDQEEADREYLRELGQAFLQKYIMPSDAMLDAMLLSREDAQKFIDAYKLSSYGGGGGGGGGSSGGSNSTTDYTPAEEETEEELVPLFGTRSNYSNSAAKDIKNYANTKAQSYEDIVSYAYNNGYYQDFSASNYGMVLNSAAKKAGFK